MIGIYSYAAAEKHGSSIYQHADGHEVEITCVCDDPDFDYHWPDKIIVGEVVKWIRDGWPPDTRHFGALRRSFEYQS